MRRRLFASINDKLAMESVCRAFADFYIANRDDFPQETQESRYFERLVHAYPIHPEVFDRLYDDWSTLDNFQRTRGVLKTDGQGDPPAVEGRQQRPADHAGQLAVVRRRRAQRVIELPAARLGPGARTRRGR